MVYFYPSRFDISFSHKGPFMDSLLNVMQVPADNVVIKGATEKLIISKGEAGYSILMTF